MASRAYEVVHYGNLYSDACVTPDGTTYGWGVTDVWYYGVTHTASVSTTLRSPNGRVAWAQVYYVPNYARADVGLAFDQNDLGDYFVNSVHDGWCPIMAISSLAS